MPALLTRMSSRPKRSLACRTMSRHEPGSAASNGMKALAAPEAARLATAASDFSRLRAATTTVAPAAARPRAMPSPMPPLPPVTIATRPERSKSRIAALPAAAGGHHRHQKSPATRAGLALLTYRQMGLSADRDRPSVAQPRGGLAGPSALVALAPARRPLAAPAA